MALARVEQDKAWRHAVKYDLRVVAALALCVLALPPVVNAIMAQAAQQADTSWLKDADFDGDPEIDDPPPVQLNPGDRPPPDRTPPPDDRKPPPQPECNEQPAGTQIALDEGVSRPTGTLTLTLRRDDRGVLAAIRGTQVTGSPDFFLERDGEDVWSYSQQSLNENVDEAPQEPEMEAARAPEVWTLRYDVGGVVYQSFDLTLVTVRCEVPSDGR